MCEWRRAWSPRLIGGVRAGTEQAHHTLLKDAGSQAIPQHPSITLSLATTPSGQVVFVTTRRVKSDSERQKQVTAQVLTKPTGSFFPIKEHGPTRGFTQGRISPSCHPWDCVRVAPRPRRSSQQTLLNPEGLH